jgi:hypothetical protein
MCSGSLDPKFLMRETEARLKSLSYGRDTGVKVAGVKAAAPQAGVFARLRALWEKLRRKETRHV